MPLTNFRYVISMSTLDGRRLDNDEQMRRSLQVRVVTPDYFKAVGIPIVQGRAIGPGDVLGSTLSVVVNETAASALWPGAPPLGHEFTLGTRLGQGGVNAGGTVVGVARDVRDHGPSAPVRPTVYLSHAQFPVSFVTIAVRGANGAPVPVESLRSILADLDAELPMFSVRTVEQLSASAVAQPRVYLFLLSLFAGTAVLLAAIGIYGVLAHAVSQRTREIGIRLALGAGRREVVAMVVGQAAGLAGAGLIAGLVLALVATGSLRTLLFGIEPTDIPTYVTVGLALLAVALLASFVPAQRAARVDPVSALRHE
jgi:predicted permease